MSSTRRKKLLGLILFLLIHLSSFIRRSFIPGLKSLRKVRALSVLLRGHFITQKGPIILPHTHTHTHQDVLNPDKGSCVRSSGPSVT